MNISIISIISLFLLNLPVVIFDLPISKEIKTHFIKMDNMLKNQMDDSETLRSKKGDIWKMIRSCQFIFFHVLPILTIILCILIIFNVKSILLLIPLDFSEFTTASGHKTYLILATILLLIRYSFHSLIPSAKYLYLIVRINKQINKRIKENE